MYTFFYSGCLASIVGSFHSFDMVKSVTIAAGSLILILIPERPAKNDLSTELLRELGGRLVVLIALICCYYIGILYKVVTFLYYAVMFCLQN